MTTDLLTTFSNQLADAVAAAAPAVVQVQGRRRPASGLVYADDVVVTMARALGREDGLRVRRHDGHDARRGARRLGSDDEPRGAAGAAAWTPSRSRSPPRPRASATSRWPSRARGATRSPRAPASSR